MRIKKTICKFAIHFNTYIMENLFSFEYQTENIYNKDGSKSRFSSVFGEKGMVIHTKKDSYNIVGTREFSSIGNAFIDKGYDVNSFVHKHGEIIGLNIKLGGNQTLSKVGDKEYNATITLPNNGGGKGFLAINENRLICTNGMTTSRLMHKSVSVKIPHTLDYKKSLVLMTESLQGFTELVKSLEQRDNTFLDQTLKIDEVQFILNEWFFYNEFPTSQRGEMTFNDFRETLAVDPDSLPCIERYEMFKKAFQDEIEYNKVLGLGLSVYTAYATVSDYLSRRREQSKSSAPVEIQLQRTESKVKYFDQFA